MPSAEDQFRGDAAEGTKDARARRLPFRPSMNLLLWLRFGAPGRLLHAGNRRLAIYRQYVIFYPLVFLVVAFLLYLLTGEIDHHVSGLRGGFTKGLIGLLIFGGDANAARSILTAITAAFVTIISVVFPLTMVVIQLASSVFTSELINNFKRSTITQLTLAFPIGLSIYSLLVLKTVRASSAGAGIYVPIIGVNVAIIWALAGLVLLVLYIGFLLRQIQPPTMMEAITRKGIRAMGSFSAPTEKPWVRAIERQPEADSRFTDVYAKRTGYVQRIEWETLFEVVRYLMKGGEERPLHISLVRTIGDEVATGDAIARIDVPTDIHRQLVAWVHQIYQVASSRTVEHDPLFASQELSDVGISAAHKGDVSVVSHALRGLTAFYGAVADQPVPSQLEVRCHGSRAIVELQTPHVEQHILRGLEHLSVQAIRQQYGSVLDAFFQATAGVMEYIVSKHAEGRRSAERRSRDATTLGMLLETLRRVFDQILQEYREPHDIVEGLGYWIDATGSAVRANDALAVCLIDFLRDIAGAARGRAALDESLRSGFERLRQGAQAGTREDIASALSAHLAA
ncbi:MAG: DUF2254 family protein [Chloroflexota bacterium]